jgi:hypothetical protein
LNLEELLEVEAATGRFFLNLFIKYQAMNQKQNVTQRTTTIDERNYKKKAISIK